MGKYIVQNGDTLMGISKKLTGSYSNYKDIAATNGITDVNKLYIGLVLNIPGYQNLTLNQENYINYTVKLGDNLTKIANLYGLNILNIIRLNNIRNPNNLYIGQKLKITPNIYKPKIRSIDEIDKIELDINKKSDLEIINYYHSKNRDGLYYIVDDKNKDKLSIYRNGVLIKSYKAIHGKNRNSDDMTITKTDSNGELINLAGNLSTPAGIYFSTKGNSYHGAPSFIRRTLLMVNLKNPNGIPSSIHARTITETANTNGCTGMSCSDLNDMSKYLNDPNIPTYILPSDKRNRFFIRNGELQFRSHNILKTPSHNTLISKPIKKIVYSTKGLSTHNRLVINLYASGLIRNKKRIQDKLGINNDTYNKLSKAALGILGVESSYGNLNTPVGNFMRFINKGIHTLVGNPNASSPDIYSKYYTYGIDNDNNSIGLTLIRLSLIPNNIKKLYKEFGITKESLVSNPEKAAIATIIKLADEYKRLGNNIDKAISSWNNKPSYLNMVKLNSSRFNIYEEYKSGGVFKRIYEKQVLRK